MYHFIEYLYHFIFIDQVFINLDLDHTKLLRKGSSEIPLSETTTCSLGKSCSGGSQTDQGWQFGKANGNVDESKETAKMTMGFKRTGLQNKRQYC